MTASQFKVPIRDNPVVMEVYSDHIVTTQRTSHVIKVAFGTARARSRTVGPSEQPLHSVDVSARVAISIEAAQQLHNMLGHLLAQSATTPVKPRGKAN